MALRHKEAGRASAALFEQNWFFSYLCMSIIA